ncbi:MAG TPA: protein kinase [Planctomycetaceae bacterium]|nr:protein kinase [Planctomycetaceae bacterium]
MLQPTAISDFSQLSADIRDPLTDWLADCDMNWQVGRVEAQLDTLPADLQVVRSVALAELVKIDIEHCWQSKIEASLESYLEIFPYLGSAETVAPDLVLSEWEARQRQGSNPSFDEFSRRFPNQANLLWPLRRRTDSTDISDEQRDTSKINNANVESLVEFSAGWLANRQKAELINGDAETISGEFNVCPENDADQDLPASFGRYRIVRKLGHGGMGEVYLAEDAQLHRQVALKVPYFDRRSEVEVLERFDREARAVAKLDHPNICRVHDVGEVDGRRFMVMEFIDGQSLRVVIQSERLTDDAAIRLVQQVAGALGSAHMKNIIHRDLKPANIMLTSDGQPKVTDFGLARRIGIDDPKLTQSGMMIGTPAYMPPEQLTGDLDNVGPHSDVYSLGVILFEVLTGHLPFEIPRNTPIAVLCARILTEPPASPTEFRQDLDPRLAAVVVKAIAKRHADRFASMSEFSAALQVVFESLGTPIRDAALPATLARGGKFMAATRAAIALTCAAVLFLGVIFWFRSGDAVVKVEILADDVAVSFVNESIKVIDGKTEYRVRPGENRLHISTGNADFDSDTFTLKRGGNPILKIEPTNDRLIVRFGDETIGSAPVQTRELLPTTPPLPAEMVQAVRAAGHGDWRIENGELYGNATTGTPFEIQLGDFDWQDYDLHVECCHIAGESFLWLRSKPDAKQRWVVAIGSWEPENVDIRAYVDGEQWWTTPSRRWLPKAVSGRTDEWHSLDVHLRGPQITVRLDDHDVASSEHAQLIKGCIGMSFTNARWRNLEVRAPDGQLLLKGWPEQLTPSTQSNQK